MKNQDKSDELVIGANPYALNLLKNKYTVFLEGFRAGYPLFIGFFPYAVALSLLGQQAGLTFWQYYLIGMLTYAGSAQLIAFGMLLSGIGFVPIFISALICNLRYFILTGSMSEMTKGWSKKQKAIVYFFTTDESFALMNNRFLEKGRPLSFAHSLGMTSMGILATSFALFFSDYTKNHLQDLNTLGFDFTLVAVFIAMLAFLVRTKKLLCLALLTGSITIFCKEHGLGAWGAIIACLSVSSLFALIDTLNEKKRKQQSS